LAEVFGWHVTAHKGREPGPDLVIEHIVSDENGERVDAVMFVESEVGHDQGGAKEYFEKVCRRVRSYVERYKKEGVGFSLVIITNAPARLTKYLREHRNELREKLGFDTVEGSTIFIVPVLMVKEVMPAVFIRAFGAPGRFT
jgi:glutaredoxin-related protein